MDEKQTVERIQYLEMKTDYYLNTLSQLIQEQEGKKLNPLEKKHIPMTKRELVKLYHKLKELCDSPALEKIRAVVSEEELQG